MNIVSFLSQGFQLSDVTCLAWREVGIVWVAALIRRVVWVVGIVAIRWVIWIIGVVGIWWVVGIVEVWWVIWIVGIVGVWWIIWIVGVVWVGWIIRVVGKSYPVVPLILVPRLVVLGISPFPDDARVPHDLFRYHVQSLKVT